MAAVATRIHEEDPIQEDETDTVIARMNVEKPWARVSSPPRRLQASSTSRRTKLDQVNALPPHLRGAASQSTQGTPIIIQRPTQDLILAHGLHDSMKATDSARFGGFKPRNSLGRRAQGSPLSRTIYSSLTHNYTPKEHIDNKRKHNELVIALEGDEDELAGPSINNRSSSPIKKRKTSISRRSSVEDYQRVEQTLSPTNGLNQRHKTTVEKGVETSTTQGGTERQKRERRRQQTVAKHQTPQKHDSNVTSPYFSVEASSLQRNEIASLPDTDVLGNDQSKASPTTAMRGFRKCLGPQSIAIDDSIQDGEETGDPIASSPTATKKSSTTRKTQDHRASSSGQRLLRKHEKCWPIEGFYTEKNVYDEGSIELVVDENTKMLGLRINDNPRSERFPMDKIYETRFSESLIRLHLRGSIAITIWIRCRRKAEDLVAQLQHIQMFKANPEKRAERMFAKWIHEREHRGSSPIKKSVEDIGAIPWQSPSSDQDPFWNDNGQALLQQNLTASEQNSDTRNPKRLKLSERLRASEVKVDGNSIATTPVRNGIRTAVAATDPLSTESKRPSRSNGKSHKSDRAYNNDDSAKSSESSKPAEAFSEQSNAQLDMPLDRDKEYGAELTDRLDSPISRRTTRATRAKRPYTDLDEQVTPAVVKYSKTHGLGPRWSEPLVWPPYGKKKVTVEFDDLERLDEEEFLNDNLVEFVLRWLRQRHNDPQNIYWFNTYFFEKISKGKGRQIDYNGVKKWTKDIDLFSYDYVVVPINENYHWYLAIICNLPRLAHEPRTKELDNEVKSVAENVEDTSGSEEPVDLELLTRSIRLSSPKPTLDKNKPIPEDVVDNLDEPSGDKDSVKVKQPPRTRGRTRDPLAPTIVTLDSLGFSHHQTIATLKQYLREEARERLGLTWEKDDIAGMTAKGIPCQNNFSDCGLYLLYYVANMLPNPGKFVSKLLMKESDMDKDWTPHLGDVRGEIRAIIQKKYQKQIRRAAKVNHGKIDPDHDSDDSSSDDIQLLEPENTARAIIGKTHRQLTPSVTEKRIPNCGSAIDNAPSGTQNGMQPLQTDGKGEGQATMHEESINISNVQPVQAEPYAESECVQEQDLCEVPETPQPSPERELPQNPSDSGGEPLDQTDEQPVLQSKLRSSSSSFSSAILGLFRHK